MKAEDARRLLNWIREQQRKYAQKPENIFCFIYRIGSDGKLADLPEEEDESEENI